MLRMPRIPIAFFAVACGLAGGLAGCRSTPAPAPAAGVNRIRTDGVYECRGVEVRVAGGGWPVDLFAPGTAPWAYFVQFCPDGEVRFAEHREPVTTAEVAGLIDGGYKGRFKGEAPSRDGDGVHIVFPRPFPVYADGVIHDGELTLQWNAGPGPKEPCVFRFVRWPQARRPSAGPPDRSRPAKVEVAPCRILQRGGAAAPQGG